MIRAGVGIARAADASAAGEQAAAEALRGAGRADAALVFAALEPGADARGLLRTVSAALGTDTIAGASAQGVLAPGREHEEASAVVVLAVTGLEVHPFLLTDLRGHEAEAGLEIAAQLGGPPRAEDLVVLLPDPRAFDPAALLQGVRRALLPATWVGAGAADPASETALQWSGFEVETGALAGMVLRGPRPPRIGITQACRAATDWLTVSRAQGHWVLALDGRPALDVYREVARGPLAEDLRRAALFLLVALPASGSEAEEPRPRTGDYVVRNVAGFAPEQGAFALPEPAKPGQQLALVLREPESARDDLKRMLEGLARPAPALGLYFDCCARAGGFFGIPGLESAYLGRAFGDAPIAGMFGSCEIGPVGAGTELLTYTGVLALLDDAPPDC